MWMPTCVKVDSTTCNFDTNKQQTKALTKNIKVLYTLAVGVHI